jgi:hypothetical protein
MSVRRVDAAVMPDGEGDAGSFSASGTVIPACAGMTVGRRRRFILDAIPGSAAQPRDDACDHTRIGIST